MTSNSTRRFASLIAAAESGAFTLPDAVLSAHTATVALSAAVERHDRGRPDPARAEADHVAALIAAATAGKPLPPPKSVAQAEAAAAEHDRQALLLTTAARTADSRLGAAVADQAAVILRDHLQVALDGLVAEVRKIADVLPADPTADAVLRLGDEARTGWFALEDLARRYSAIRSAAQLVRRLTGEISWDARHEYAELKNFEAVHPTYRTETAGVSVVANVGDPWPTEPRARLLWLIAHDAQLWTPTIPEQDARWWEVHGEKVEAMRESRQRVAGSRGQFG